MSVESNFAKEIMPLSALSSEWDVPNDTEVLSLELRLGKGRQSDHFPFVVAIATPLTKKVRAPRARADGSMVELSSDSDAEELRAAQAASNAADTPAGARKADDFDERLSESSAESVLTSDESIAAAAAEEISSAASSSEHNDEVTVVWKAMTTVRFSQNRVWY